MKSQVGFCKMETEFAGKRWIGEGYIEHRYVRLTFNAMSPVYWMRTFPQKQPPSGMLTGRYKGLMQTVYVYCMSGEQLEQKNRVVYRIFEQSMEERKEQEIETVCREIRRIKGAQKSRRTELRRRGTCLGKE